jgi:transmembrane sensor
MNAEMDVQHKARVEQAADWLLRLRDPAVTPVEIAEWLAWCNASAENKTAYARMQSLWRTSSGLTERKQYGRLRRPVVFALAASIALIALIGLWWRFSAAPSKEVSIAARVGVNREVSLPDGTGVTVAAGSRMATHFTETERMIVLESGEAFFKVKKDRNRPFVVHALDATVTAVGTAFNVRAEEGIVRVAVTEGSVDVSGRAAESIHLSAGHEVTLASSEQKPVMAAVDSRRVTAWVGGTLRFVDEPLVSVVAAVNRYSSVPVRLADEALGMRHYTGTVMAGRIDEWLRGLPDVFPVAITKDGSEVVIEPASLSGR